MAVELWFDDGNPWYLSPDIWVVPGATTDAPGQATEDEPAYVWARAHNRGTTAVNDANVRFYWADPSTQVTRATAPLIGSSSVSLAAGETKEVLCLTAWVPQFVNNGHECLIVEVFAPTDPLPPTAASDPFNVPTDRHVAQLNLAVAEAAAGAMLIYPFVAGAGFGTGAFVEVRREPIELLKALEENLGVRLPEEAPDFDGVGLLPYRCGDRVEGGEPRFELAGERRTSMALVARVPKKLPEGTGALFLVEQIAGDEVVGGVALLARAAAPADDAPKRRQKRPRRESAVS